MATRAQQFEILAAGVLYDAALIDTPYVKFLDLSGSEKYAWTDKDKSVAITKKALDAQGRGMVYGDGIYTLAFYSGDPDGAGVKLFEVVGYKCIATLGNTRTVTANTTLTIDDTLILADTTDGDITITLADAALMQDRQVFIQKISASNTATIAAPTGQTIDNAASVDVTGNNAALNPKSDGSNWYGTQSQGDATTLGGEAATGYVKTAGTTPMLNATSLKGRNAADDANIDLAQVDSSDVVQIGDPDNALKINASADPVVRIGGTDYKIWTENSDGKGSGLTAQTCESADFATLASTVASANQTDQEAGTSSSKAVTPSVQQYHPSAAKAWVNFNGTGTVSIYDDYNVTSITDNGVGDYTVNFTTPFATDNYAVGGTPGYAGADESLLNRSQLAASVRVNVFKSGGGTGTIDTDRISVICYGDQ